MYETCFEERFLAGVGARDRMRIEVDSDKELIGLGGWQDEMEGCWRSRWHGCGWDR